MDENFEKVSQIKNNILAGLKESGIIVVGDNTSPYILNIIVEGVMSETLVNAMSSKGIYISSGSSCSSKAATKNILEHYGIHKKMASSAVRLSFSKENTREEAEFFIKEFKEQINLLRKFSRKG